MKTYQSLLLAAVVASTYAYIDYPATFTNCKMFEICCDDVGCLNNCELYPDCSAWSHIPSQGNIDPLVAIGECNYFFGYSCCRDASGCGDPHFETWGGSWFDFHGECDLNFIHAPSFGQGVGMDVHVRTKIRNDFSYIEAAAVKIGDDVLIVGGWGEVIFNGVQVPKTELPKHVGAFSMEHDMVDEATHNYRIFIAEHQYLLVKSFKDYVSVKFSGASPDNFRDSKGLLGDFVSGKRFARDGYTEIANDIEYGMEWQVRPEEEPSLFQSNDLVPQYPQRCNMPPMTADGRRLAEAKVSDEVAQKACAHMEDEAHKRMCIYDVQATGDLSISQAAF